MSKVYTVEVLEQHATDAQKSLVEMVSVYAAESPEQAVQWVIRGIVSSNYGQNYTRYGYRGYERGTAGKNPSKEHHVEVPWLRGRAPMASMDYPQEELKIGRSYTVALVQRGLKSKNPWVEAQFAHRDKGGKVITETTAEDGKNYLLVRLQNDYLFRIDGDALTLGGGQPRLKVTLFAILP